TATAQIIAFRIEAAAFPAIALGFAMSIAGRREGIRNWGATILGFGLLFLGLSTMADTLKPLRDSYAFQRFFQTFDCGPAGGALMRPDRVLGAIGIGTALTLIIQSSSATVGLTMALAGSGLINFYTAVPLVLGDNIGTTITAILASLGGNRVAKQTACAHALFNVFGATYMFILFYVRWGGEPVFLSLVEEVTPGVVLGADAGRPENIERHIAMAHSLFNIFNAILFLPFAGVLAAVCRRIIPAKRDEPITRLEPHLLDTPEIALEQARAETLRLARLARTFLDEVVQAFRSGGKGDRATFVRKETEIDRLDAEITNYLVELSRRTLLDREAKDLQAFLHDVRDFERVGDLAENIGGFAGRLATGEMTLSEDAIGDVDRIYGEIALQFDEVIESLEAGDRAKARHAMRREERIDVLCDEADARHLARLREGQCDLRAGFIFRDLIGTFEKIGDHLDNVAEETAESGE
ncbi:MAG: Na/Pi cotransporter family protein, partial [Planctomycetes bacterium]|nr:Na/Pi cotransporter family protein [Planctomycetota bacterium]